MAMTYLAGAQEVARNVGGSSITAQTTIAKQAIVDAIREIDSRHNFEFTRQTLTDITVVSGTAVYALVANTLLTDPPVKRIYTARLKTNKRTLVFVRTREWDRVVREQETNNIPIGYDEVLAPTSISIKLFPTPNAGDLLSVKVYLHIQDTYVDGDNLGVPNRYLPAVLARARYNFLIDRDADDSRADKFYAISEDRIAKAIADDIGAPDEDIRLVPTDEWIGAQGPTDPLGGWEEM